MNPTPFHLQAQLDQIYRTQPRQLPLRAQTDYEFAAWQQTLCSKITDLLGLSGRTLPTTPDAELLHTLDRGEYVEEKYALDVGGWVAAPMYVLVPKTAPPYKAILGFHGHDPSVQNILGNYPDAETASDNLAVDGNWAQALAQAGYLVCAVEQRGFGERLTDQRASENSRSSCRHLAFEYLMEGRVLLGERCWDGMVALSYLQNRADVTGGIGCTGHSGGATTALWLSALDERIAVSVVSCYFCSFKASILSMEHCECNYVPRILEYAEMGDLAALIAPRPLRFIQGERDPIFPLSAAQEQYETVKRAYALLNADEHLSMSVHPGAHAYHHGYAQEWFGRWL